MCRVLIYCCSVRLYGCLRTARSVVSIDGGCVQKEHDDRVASHIGAAATDRAPRPRRLQLLCIDALRQQQHVQPRPRIQSQIASRARAVDLSIDWLRRLSTLHMLRTSHCQSRESRRGRRSGRRSSCIRSSCGAPHSWRGVLSSAMQHSASLASAGPASPASIAYRFHQCLQRR